LFEVDSHPRGAVDMPRGAARGDVGMMRPAAETGHMPKYYFHFVSKGHFDRDVGGMVLPNRAAAIVMAEDVVGMLVSGGEIMRTCWVDWTLDVTDESETTLASLPVVGGRFQ
jgi:hypothetical protein